ncbi:MAG: hypothetical protein ACK5Y2_09945 [Bdellovibrionales bacterium]
MSDKRIKTFIYCHSETKIVLFCKRVIGLDISLQIPEVTLIQIVSSSPFNLGKDLQCTFTAESGFVELPKEALVKPELLLLRQKIETLTLLNMNIQLALQVISERFSTEFANSIPVSPENFAALRNFLDEEKKILMQRCHDKLNRLYQEVLPLKTEGEVQAFYKDFVDHTIIGDYSAAFRGQG